MMFSRRKLLRAGILLLPSAVLHGLPVTAQTLPRSRHTFGCWLAPDEFHEFQDQSEPIRTYFTGNEPIIPKSGNAAFDYALAQTLAIISKLYGVYPGFGYYDDYDGLNAYASPEPRTNRPDGMVLFGTRLLQRELAAPQHPEVAVASVCAHEFGHSVQFKKGLRNQLLNGQTTVKRLELHADFVAGVFAGFRQRDRPSFPAVVFAMTQQSAGDDMINSPQHHGTPAERGNAIREGFKAVKVRNLNFDDAVDAGVTYVMSL